MMDPIYTHILATHSKKLTLKSKVQIAFSIKTNCMSFVWIGCLICFIELLLRGISLLEELVAIRQLGLHIRC